MSKHKRTLVDPYSDGEFDAEFIRTQRSDPAYVITRVVTLVAVYAILGRGVYLGELGAGMLLLPITVEWLAVMWVGYFMALFVVDCPAFRKSANRPILTAFWTLLILGVISARLAWTGEGFDPDRVLTGWAWLTRRVVETGLIWALVVEVGGLIAATVPEVRRWRKVGGVFVWTAIMNMGLRIAALIVIGMIGGFIAIWLADVVDYSKYFDFAWFVFGFLLLIELGGLLLGVFMHRDIKKKGVLKE